MGIALALPRNLEREREEAARAALTGIEIDATIATRWRMFDGVLNGLDNLKLGNLGVWQIGWIAESSKRSLQPERYAGPSTRWSSVTPVALDRHAKSKGMDEWQSEVEEIIASSCVNVGLPRPMGVKLMKHSAVAGAPSYPSGNAPSWTGWTLPGALRGRMLTHVSVEFAEKVQGPVILGAGRFQGLGLCLPAAGRES